MKLGPVVLSLSLATLAAPHAFAAAARFEPVPSTSDPIPGPGYSSSADLPDAPSFAAASHTGYEGAMTHMRLATTPFSAFALGLKVGAEGIGFEVATPLATKINLRASASFLNYSPTVTEDGIPINGKLTFRTISAGADLYPYRNSFHITPGITMYNGNHASATTNIAGGSMFTVNDAQYQSSAADPVHGTFVVDFGRKFAPSLTAGFGNMLRKTQHWNLQSEFGVEYIGRPKFTLNMQGTVCDPSDGCQAIQDDPDTMQNLAQEQATVNKEISLLRFYPIASIGLSYRFGRNRSVAYWK